MIKENVQEAINGQIQAELQSAYQYLAYAAWFDSKNLKGFSHWMRIQWREEIEHAMKFYDHILRRDGDVDLKDVNKPSVDIETPEECFENVLAQEQNVTKKIHKLYDLAKNENDYPLQTLLHWFIDEQVEEEEAAQEILEKLQLIGDHGPNLYLLDQELGQRPANPDEGGNGESGP